MTIILVILTSYATSTFGIIVNLYFPKFEFKNEVEVYKQSIAMMIFMFGLMGLTVGFGLIGYFLITNMKLIFILVKKINTSSSFSKRR